MDYQDICRRFDAVKAERSIVQNVWDVIERFVTPYRGRMFEDQRQEGSIEWQNREVFDSTAISSHQDLASAIHGGLTSPAIKWFEMRFRDEKLNKNKKATKWLQDASDRTYHELQDSNFKLEINECYQDVAGPGTCFMLLEEANGPVGQWNGLQFSSVPLKEGYFETDYMGRVLRFYRLLRWTPGQIISKFGTKVPESILEAEKASNTAKLDVLYAIYPKNNKIVPVGNKAAASRRAYGYSFILKDSCELLGKEGGFYEMPAFSARWRTTSESIWGNSPAHVALPDILSLNEARKLQLVASAKMIDPPIFADERTLIYDLDLSPSTVNVVRDVDRIKPFDTKGSIAVSDHTVETLQASVRDYFSVDKFRLPGPQAQPMTAFEVQRRMEEIERFLGPTVSRLTNDMLDPIVSRAFRMLFREGQIEQPPEEVKDFDSAFDIEYVGSLGRAQKVDRATSIERWIGGAIAMSEVIPNALDVVNADNAMRQSARDLNIPADVVNSEAEVKVIRDEREQAQKDMQAAQVAEQQGKAAEAIGAGSEALGGQ